MTPTRDQITAARDNYGLFAELVGSPREPWQVSSLQLRKRMTMLQAPRQTGKSDSLAVLALWWAFRKRGQMVLIISAGDDSAKELVAKISAIAAASPLLSGSVVDDLSARITLSNGSVIRSVPASARQIRGPSVDLLIIDEAALVSMIDEGRLITGAALPTTMARPDARVVLASNPLGKSGYFYEQVSAAHRGAETIEAFRWHLEDAWWVTPEVEAALREQIPDVLLQRAELDGEFVDLDGGHRLVPQEWIDAAVRRTLRQPAAGVVSVDVARFGGDRTVVYANRGGALRLLIEARGWATTQTASEVTGVMRSELDAPPAPYVIVVDDSGVGGGVTDQLRLTAGEVGEGVGATSAVAAFNGAHRPVDRPHFANRRAETFWLMRKAFEDGSVDVAAEDRSLLGQLADLVYEYDAKGRIRMESKDEMRARGVKSPDHADAVAMSFATEAWRPPVEWGMTPEELAAHELGLAVAESEAYWSERRWRSAMGAMPESETGDVGGPPSFLGSMPAPEVALPTGSGAPVLGRRYAWRWTT
jgi:hypothetical protein